jgi:hypothetical protein
MAIPTQFSVTKQRKCPIANPLPQQDGPSTVDAEDVSIIGGASALDSIMASGVDAPEVVTSESAGDIDAPVAVTPEDAQEVGTAVTLPAQSAPDIDEPTELNAQAAASITTPSAVSSESAPSIPTPSALTPNVGTLTAPPFPLNHARILYDNKLEAYDSISSDVASNAINAIKRNTWEAWTPSGPGYFKLIFSFDRGVDTICIGAHNLSNKGYSLAAFYRKEESGPLLPFGNSVTPTDNAPIMIHNDISILMRVIEIYISNGSGSARVGYISAGDALQMQRPFFNGHVPITDGDVTTYYSNRTESGEIIGQQIRRQGYETSADWQNIDDTWYRTYFAPFKQAIKDKPFFFAWNLLEYPNDVGFCRVSQDISAPMQNGTVTKRSISMKLLGVG